MIKIELLDKALQLVVAQGYLLSSSLFQSYLSDGKKTCCIIRAAAIAADANNNNVEDLVKGAAEFLGVPIQEVWAFVDGLEGKKDVDFENESINWLYSTHPKLQSTIDRFKLNRYVKWLPIKDLLFRTLKKDFELGQALKKQFEFAEAASYLMREGIDIVA